ENRQHDTSHHLIGLLRPWILACSLPCQLEYRASRPHRPARARRSPVHGGLAVAVVRRYGQLTHGGVGRTPSMASPPRSIIETRYEQMFPVLEPRQVERLRHFGEMRTYRASERLVTSGEISPGMFIVLSGEVAVTQHSVLGRDQPIVSHGPGSFMGELAQLSGRPPLVDARAPTAV